MNIKIEIDVTPAELRQFLGLPDVAGLQEEMIEYVRNRVTKGAEGFDPAEFVRENVWGNRAVQKLISMAKMRLDIEEAEEQDRPKPPKAPKKPASPKTPKSTTDDKS